MASKTFTVEEIHCGSCENTIRTTLGAVEGISTVEPDRETNQVTVEFDESTVDAGTVARQLTDAGYPVVT